MLVGWLVVYLLSYAPAFWLVYFLTLGYSYPVYGFFLPIYSFWCMDDFSWGNTRVVIGEGGNKKVLMNEEERFHESMIPLKKFSGTSLIWLRCLCHTDACGQSTNARLGSVVLITRMKVESRSLSLMLTPRDDLRRHVKALLNLSTHRIMATTTATLMQ